VAALPQELERAFEALEVAAGGTPWALTDAFVSALHEGRGRLALTGPGDPTGRGLGFSYMRDDRRVRRPCKRHPAADAEMAARARRALPLSRVCLSGSGEGDRKRQPSQG
jgi:hypothetical protein